ncbi:hypothetical protein N7U66_03790 [Lacinutrix neustonica]|uniref:TerB family tellurite resistance protein n=1 Tax=Lacinutrix neustonica TaxID=2980107 RepID=A0A9E8MYW4_9FLAO|nr:hypothetical protein [Lacinutrix neustonica]WAC02790.1 hypothetical protein N7U66_03790 [Lacinutrix neustonica]
MKGENNYPRAFYQNLGKLFYAIALADGEVHEVEISTLEHVIEKEWATGSEAFPILDVFNWLHEDQEYNAEDCFKSFMAFKNNNEALFTNQIKHLILSTANKVASSFARKNKSELILLARLDLAFKIKK